MEKKPKVFQNTISKKIVNNSTYSLTRGNGVNDNASISQKINKIFSDRNFIYKADVVIKTNSGCDEKEIIAKKGNNLVTIDNEIIPIKDIIDIYRKN